MIKDPKTVALEFNECINNRNIDLLAELMTDDHSFIDSADNHLKGKQHCLTAWSSFFNSFPDYKNIFGIITSNDNMATMQGRSHCADKRLEGKAIWTARITGNKISEWRVYEDTPENRIKLNPSI